MIAVERLFNGTLDSSAVHARELVRAALAHNAGAVILAHNHPSGVAEPSAADRDITDQIKRAMQVIGVRVLDHFVIGSNAPVSFAERGWRVYAGVRKVDDGDRLRERAPLSPACKR